MQQILDDGFYYVIFFFLCVRALVDFPCFALEMKIMFVLCLKDEKKSRSFVHSFGAYMERFKKLCQRFVDSSLVIFLCCRWQSKRVADKFQPKTNKKSKLNRNFVY